MPNEPIAIFSAREDARGVLAHLRNLFPDAEVESASTTWRTVTVRFGEDGNARALTFLHDPGTYAGPDWPRRRAGLLESFPRLPAGERKAQFRSTIDSLRFALDTSFEPDFDPDGDERLGVVFEVAQFLDGVLVSPSAVRDAGGRILVGADGGSDADAVWPTPADVVLTPTRTPVRLDGPARPPGPKRVARRAAVLMAVVGRAVVERELRLKRVSPEHAAEMHDRLLRWLSDLRVEVEFEPTEDALLQATPGRLSERHFTDAMWQVEGLAVLGWALGRLDLPRYDELVSIDAVWEGLGFLEAGEVRQWLARPPLRPRDHLEPVRRQMQAYHRRLDEFGQSRRAADFRDAVAGGPSDVAPFELIDGDLALVGRRIDEAAPEVLDTCRRIAAERGRAIAWLCGGSDRYSESDVGA
ncbi:MAG TPA: DUF4272 domain-containing protein [Fimbriiglobus sp.]|jgi:hypothetical protein|nr:DUF4272 domain-containing protein [Fimbriiglobus sp.]